MKGIYDTGKLAFHISNKLRISIYSVIKVLDLLEFNSPQELTKREVMEWTAKVSEVLNTQ